MRAFGMIALVSALLSGGPAFATGGFSCRIDDPVLSLDVESGFSHGMGDGLLNFGGTIEMRDRFAPETLRKVTLDPTHLPHHWLYADSLKLRIYAETDKGAFASLDLVIETSAKGGDEGTYAGDYRLTLYRVEPPAGAADPQVVKTGKVACLVG
ncbi:hypothetical protein [Pararhizobium antarcticum]|uniref:Uncharacterized protein n=1 Tax=Pararhizobium antarcticum TaxID=1798805 RepID=A0A657LX60_9HYPH|nr:hypothetical protein [Pararhizobium antarcticum]OJF90358.1 hypothetical protein AX761_06725 [Rhizobium sp. 58]OJG00580.1 hypothetical protein AX760_10465 [Pararhizobium antarcticum]